MNTKKITGYPNIDLPHEKTSTFFEKKPIIPSMDTITILKILSKKIRDLKAVNCDELSATYQQLIDDSHKLSLAYRELGVRKKDIVVLSLPSDYQALISFLALNEIGAVTTFIDTYSNKDDIIKYLNDYESPIFVNFDMNENNNAEIISKTGIKHIITLSRGNVNSRIIDNDYHINNSDTFIDFHTLGSLSPYQKNKIHLPNTGLDDSLILYTSGSTGQPKAVVLTNKNVLAAQMYAGNTSHTENITGTKTMTCVPLRYPYGMVTSLLTSLLWGKEAIMTPRWDSNTVEYYFKKNPNIVFGSPAVLDLTMKKVPDGMDLSQVSHFISGGDFLSVEHANRAYDFFRKHGNNNLEIGNGCGNAETVSIGSTPVGVPLKQSTAGKILVGSTPLIIDKEITDEVPIINLDENKIKRCDELGELCLAGAHVFKEYFGEPDKTKCSKFKYNGKEFFRTGTLGFIDEDGYFTPLDRKSRFFIRSTGHKVYLDNVQRIIELSDDRIIDCATVKVPDEDELFVTKAYIVLKKGLNSTEEIKQQILNKLMLPIITNGKAEQLKEYEIPRFIEIVDEIPKMYGSEKTNYLLLEEQAIEPAKILVKK